MLLLASTWLALCCIEWHAIATASHEMGDAAANSLLVQDAKSLTLLVGNYSRLGFHHPGPALLYLLAFGEWAFHDVLHVVPSPYAGQLVAVALYNASWIVAGFGVLRRLSGSSSNAAWTGAVFLIAAVAWNPEMLTSAWFPHLYILPFAVMLLALARVACGRLDAVIALAVSAGVLLNGHVAFTAIVGCLAVATSLIHAMFLLASGSGVVPLVRRLTRHERRHVLVASALFVALLSPFAIQTVLHWPGPVADYLGFGQSHRPNEASDASTFVGLFWTMPTELAAWLVAFAVLRHRREPDPWVTRWKGLAWLLPAATATAYLYALFGIDLLSQTYIAYFYGAVPAWAIALAALRVRQWLPAAVQGVVPWPVAGLLIATTLVISQPREGDVTPALASQVPAFDAATERLGGGQQVIFDLDASRHYSAVWPFLVGVAVHARREGRQPFCIDRGWHVLFTDALRCDGSSPARRYLVRSVDDGAALRLQPVFAYGGVGVFAEAATSRDGGGVR